MHQPNRWKSEVCQDCRYSRSIIDRQTCCQMGAQVVEHGYIYNRIRPFPSNNEFCLRRMKLDTIVPVYYWDDLAYGLDVHMYGSDIFYVCVLDFTHSYLLDKQESTENSVAVYAPFFFAAVGFWAKWSKALFPTGTLPHEEFLIIMCGNILVCNKLLAFFLEWIWSRTNACYRIPNAHGFFTKEHFSHNFFWSAINVVKHRHGSTYFKRLCNSIRKFNQRS